MVGTYHNRGSLSNTSWMRTRFLLLPPVKGPRSHPHTSGRIRERGLNLSLIYRHEFADEELISESVAWGEEKLNAALYSAGLEALTPDHRSLQLAFPIAAQELHGHRRPQRKGVRRQEHESRVTEVFCAPLESAMGVFPQLEPDRQFEGKPQVTSTAETVHR